MKLKQIAYAFLPNGNYENEKIELTAELEADDDWEAALNDLKSKVHSQLGTEQQYWEIMNKIRKAEHELRVLHEQIDKAKANYEIVSRFMVAQGLKPDMPQFPELPQLPAFEQPAEEAELL